MSRGSLWHVACSSWKKREPGSGPKSARSEFVEFVEFVGFSGFVEFIEWGAAGRQPVARCT